MKMETLPASPSDEARRAVEQWALDGTSLYGLIDFETVRLVYAGRVEKTGDLSYAFRPHEAGAGAFVGFNFDTARWDVRRGGEVLGPGTIHIFKGRTLSTLYGEPPLHRPHVYLGTEPPDASAPGIDRDVQDGFVDELTAGDT